MQGEELLVDVLEEGSRCQVPIAIARTRRGEALVWWQCVSQESVHRAAGQRERVRKDASSSPKMEGPGVARRMRLEIVDSMRRSDRWIQ